MCECLEKAENTVIGKYKNYCDCTFGEIETIGKEGEVKKHGWGIRFSNYKIGNDSSFLFIYCPWCGRKIEE
jgi:hypothetical protein